MGARSRSQTCGAIGRAARSHERKGLSTPGIPEGEEQKMYETGTEEEAAALIGEDVSMFRGVAARSNYLGMDRPDIMYTAKEICREMSAPTTRSLRRVKRLARFLKERPRLVWKYPMQEEQEVMDVYADASWAGCRVSRKSTSGGCIMLGRHCLKAWAKTQAVIALSSAESELYGIVRASCEGLGLGTLLKELGREVKCRVHVDASAAIGVVERKGLSKVRHLETDTLWLQEAQARRMMPLRKILGKINPADLMTKQVSARLMSEHLDRMNLVYEDGRAEVAAKLH